MYSTTFGATGWGTQLPVQYPQASNLNLPRELCRTGFNGFGQEDSRMGGGTALLVTGLVAASAAGIGVLIAWLAERRQRKAGPDLSYYR
jgi:hypothetical protein